MLALGVGLEIKDVSGQDLERDKSNPPAGECKTDECQAEEGMGGADRDAVCSPSLFPSLSLSPRLSSSLSVSDPLYFVAL